MSVNLINTLLNTRTRILVVIFLLSTTLTGQEIPYSFFHLTSKDGLLINTVQSITQDEFGYMWFGSYQGLQRYDGYSFDSFLHDASDSTSISSNQIQTLLYTSKGELWIGSENGGLNRFDFVTETFEHYFHNPENENSLSSNYINHIFEDTEGSLWISTREGLNKYVDSTKTFIRFFCKDELDVNFISQVHSSDSEYLWVATLGSGLIKLDLKTSAYNIYSTDIPENVNSDEIWSVYHDSLKQKLWIGTIKGLNVWNFITNKFEYYYYEDFELERSGRNVVRNILPGIGNDIWLASDGGGLYLLNHEKGIFREFMVNESAENSIGANSLTSLFKDKDDNLWVGLVFGGLDRINLAQNPVYQITNEMSIDHIGLNNSVVNSVYIDCNKEYWFGTEDGLSRSKDLKSFRHYSEGVNKKTTLNNSVVLSIFESTDNELWCGTYLGGISILNKNTNTFKHIDNDPDARLSISSNFVRSIYEDKTGNFWIGSIRGGLDVYYPDKDTILNFTHLVESDFVMKIISDSEQNKYVATYGNGVYKISSKMEVLDHFYAGAKGYKSIIYDLVSTIVFDSDSNLLIGTANGLSIVNIKNRKTTHYTIQDGLPANAIFAIVEDNNNDYWFSTNKGLSNLNRQSMAFTNYNKTDGFLSNEFRYNSVFKDEKGRLYFGGVDGVCYFNPDEIISHDEYVNLSFTKLLVFNNEIKVGNISKNQTILKTPIGSAKRLVLNHKNRMFTLCFSTFNFKQIQNINYYYQLNSGEAIDLGRENKVSFHNLPYGNYILEIFAVNTATNVELGSKSIEIELKPPLYLTLFFKILLIVAFISLFVLFYFVRLNSIHRQKKVLEQKVYEKTIDLQETNTLLEEQQAELEMQTEELFAQKDFVDEQNTKIKEQNLELDLHKTDLEKLVNDRTKELVKAKEVAEKADALKTAFLANMSHEIRTPMNAILGFIDIMDESDYTEEEKKTFKGLIHSSGDSLLSLINDIIDIAKIESGELDIHNNNFELGTLFNNLQTIYTKKIEKQNPNINLLYKGVEDIVLYSDEHRIMQVMINLLDNAVKFTEKGIVEFGYLVERGSVLFYVKDTGVGIELDEQINIFRRFRKLETNTDKVYRGTGLGLAISKHLVELMGGVLKVESEPNVGSTFSFKLSI